MWEGITALFSVSIPIFFLFLCSAIWSYNEAWESIETKLECILFCGTNQVTNCSSWILVVLARLASVNIFGNNVDLEICRDLVLIHDPLRYPGQVCSLTTRSTKINAGYRYIWVLKYLQNSIVSWAQRTSWYDRSPWLRTFRLYQVASGTCKFFHLIDRLYLNYLRRNSYLWTYYDEVCLHRSPHISNRRNSWNVLVSTRWYAFYFTARLVFRVIKFQTLQTT